jgi:alpha-D-xyloside xylohydrolase
MRRFQGLLLLFSLLCLCSTGTVRAQWNPLNPVLGVQRESDGVQLTLQNGTLKLQVCSDSMIRVRYSATMPFPSRQEFLVIKDSWPATKWEMQSSEEAIVLSTSQLKAVVARKDGSVTFQDSAGKTLFEQNEVSMTPAVVNGEQTYHAELYSKLWGSYESFYGLGQHQAGVWNYRGEVVDISQDNTNISIPFVLSSDGYGIFWNNASRSRFNNRFLNALYLSSEVADVLDYYFLYGPEFERSSADTGNSLARRRCLASGRMDSGNAKINTTRRRNCLGWRTNTGNCTFPRTTSCRTGSGGTPWVNRCSTKRAIPTLQGWSKTFTKTSSI